MLACAGLYDAAGLPLPADLLDVHLELVGLRSGAVE
jgi:hypothetical protein